MTRPRALLAFAALLATPAAAEVFKCKGAGGEAIYSNEPCAEVGARTERRLRRDELRSNAVRMPTEPRKRERPPTDVAASGGSRGEGASSGQSIDPDLKIYEGSPPDGGRPGAPRSVVLDHHKRQR